MQSATVKMLVAKNKEDTVQIPRARARNVSVTLAVNQICTCTLHLREKTKETHVTFTRGASIYDVHTGGRGGWYWKSRQRMKG